MILDVWFGVAILQKGVDAAMAASHNLGLAE
jgi:hypothetical protein